MTEPPTHHRVYLIHDHDPEDAPYRDKIKSLLGSLVVGETPPEADALSHFDDADVAIVLVGERTWRSPRVDAEIATAVSPTQDGARLGLVGWVMRCYDYPALSARQRMGDTDLFPTQPRGQSWWARNVPRRLYENAAAGFAAMRPHPDPGVSPAAWIHEATLARVKVVPAPVRPVVGVEPSEDAIGWDGPAQHHPILSSGDVRVRAER